MLRTAWNLGMNTFDYNTMLFVCWADSLLINMNDKVRVRKHFISDRQTDSHLSSQGALLSISVYSNLFAGGSAK